MSVDLPFISKRGIDKFSILHCIAILHNIIFNNISCYLLEKNSLNSLKVSLSTIKFKALFITSILSTPIQEFLVTIKIIYLILFILVGIKYIVVSYVLPEKYSDSVQKF